MIYQLRDSIKVTTGFNSTKHTASLGDVNPLFDPDYPNYTDKKIQQLSTTSVLTDEKVEKFPTLKPHLFPVYDWTKLENATDEIHIFLRSF